MRLTPNSLPSQLHVHLPLESFCLAKQDVIDESYRKARKMDSSEFATQFSPVSSGIMEGIRRALFGGRAADNINAELYKLNIYGISTVLFFFPMDPHITLVVVLSTKHEGGTLLIPHGGHEFSFDSAGAINRDCLRQAPFVAFYSDVEHEVSIVTTGYRVTLTYNLHLVPCHSRIATELASSDLPSSVSTKSASS